MFDFTNVGELISGMWYVRIHVAPRITACVVLDVTWLVDLRVMAPIDVVVFDGVWSCIDDGLRAGLQV